MKNLILFIINTLKEKTKKTLNYLKEYLLWFIFIAIWTLLTICAAVFATAFLFWNFNIVEIVFTNPFVIRTFILIVLSVSLFFTLAFPNYFSDRIKKSKQKLEQND